MPGLRRSSLFFVRSPPCGPCLKLNCCPGGWGEEIGQGPCKTGPDRPRLLEGCVQSQSTSTLSLRGVRQQTDRTFPLHCPLQSGRPYNYFRFSKKRVLEWSTCDHFDFLLHSCQLNIHCRTFKSVLGPRRAHSPCAPVCSDLSARRLPTPFPNRALRYHDGSCACRHPGHGRGVYSCERGIRARILSDPPASSTWAIDRPASAPSCCTLRAPWMLTAGATSPPCPFPASGL